MDGTDGINQSNPKRRRHARARQVAYVAGQYTRGYAEQSFRDWYRERRRERFRQQRIRLRKRQREQEREREQRRSERGALEWANNPIFMSIYCSFCFTVSIAATFTWQIDNYKAEICGAVPAWMRFAMNVHPGPDFCPPIKDNTPGWNLPFLGGSSDIMGDLRQAIASQESGHDYLALNRDSGAMGKYQFMPDTARRFVSFMNTSEFLNSPSLQEKAFEGYVTELHDQAVADGLNGCELARAVASGWYSGDIDLRDSTAPQFSNGREYPSISDYSDSIAAQTDCSRWGLGGSATAFPVDLGLAPRTKTSLFGDRIHPVTGVPHHHNGVDIHCNARQPLIASVSGRVTLSPDPDGFGDYAFYITDSQGRHHWYGHGNNLKVSDGDRVKAGDRVGECASEGLSTGNHLHYEIRQGGNSPEHAIDPLPFLESIQ